MDADSCKLLMNYFSERLHRVNVGDNASDWLTISKGTPQGSLMGPFVYNICTNDIILQLTKERSDCVYNYANTVSACDKILGGLQAKLSEVSGIFIQWFSENYMQANPSKFQYILFDEGGKEHERNLLLISQEIGLKAVNCIRPLGVDVGQSLSFKGHISKNCNKAGRHLNALSSLSHVLSSEAKLRLVRSFIILVSNFNSCPTLWHYSSISDTKMEKIQERALRFVYCDFQLSY